MRVAVLVTLIVYFAAMLALTLTLPAIWAMSREARLTSQRAMGDTVASALAHIPPNDATAYEHELRRLRATYPIVSITSDSNPSPSARRTDNIQRRSVNGTQITIEFAADTQAESQMRRALFASTAAAFAGLLLLGIAGFDFMRDPRFGRDTSVSDRMVATLGTSVLAMKGRETEARERAAELSTITSTLVRSLTSGFIALDEEGRILDVNLAARELLREEAAATGLSPSHALQRPRFAQALQGAADERQALQRHEVVEEDGTVFGLTTVPLLDDRGRYFGMLALFVDLTDVRHLEQRVRQMQSLADLGEMSAGIAHEFRNSLSTILGYLRLAQKGDASTRPDGTLARAEAEAKELAAAVDSLLTFARPLRMQRREIDLAELIAPLIDRMLPSGTSVKVTTHFETTPVSADPALLSRAMDNLLRNAWESIAEKGVPGEIHVEVRREPAPRVIIRDTGVGLEPAQTARLFVPFQSTKANGFGVGLALTRKIILSHGGSVTLTGEAGIGATAEVELPRVVVE